MFITLISDLNDQAKHSVWAKFAEGTKLSGAADAPEGCATIHTDLDRLEKWADGSLMKFNMGKCKALHTGSDNPLCQ